MSRSAYAATVARARSDVPPLRERRPKRQDRLPQVEMVEAAAGRPPRPRRGSSATPGSASWHVWIVDTAATVSLNVSAAFHEHATSGVPPLATACGLLPGTQVPAPRVRESSHTTSRADCEQQRARDRSRSLEIQREGRGQAIGAKPPPGIASVRGCRSVRTAGTPTCALALSLYDGSPPKASCRLAELRSVIAPPGRAKRAATRSFTVCFRASDRWHRDGVRARPAARCP